MPRSQPQTSGSDPNAWHGSKVIYIAPHTLHSKSIKIFDLTNLVGTPRHSDEFFEETEALGKAKLAADDDAAWLLRLDPTPRGFGKNKPFICTEHNRSEDDATASWFPSAWTIGKNRVAFPAGSPHSEHEIVMTRPKSWSRTEGFVKDSIQFLWRHDGISRRSLGLWTVIGGQESLAAQYKSPVRFTRTGGTLLVDTTKVDLVVAFLTCAAMLRKIMQDDST
ncbi:hypothetical protein QBC39DRAFT_29717 [Podospora conica]|nr:hypothetical protein QBC39DRAFT_29717 [Schizothecium conicum]